MRSWLLREHLHLERICGRDASAAVLNGRCAPAALDTREHTRPDTLSGNGHKAGNFELIRYFRSGRRVSNPRPSAWEAGKVPAIRRFRHV